MFSVSQSLDKHAFIALYKDVVLLSALFVAPVGLPDHACSIFQRKDFVLNEILPTYRQCEEFIAKRLFSLRGVSDDVIAATMHTLVAEKADTEISQLFRLGTSTLDHMVEAPSIVLLPPNCSPAQTAELVDQVLSAMEDAGKALVSKDILCVKDRLRSAGRSSMFIGDTIDAIPDRVIQRLLKAFQHADGSDSVTYDQYMALLDAHCSDTAVVAVLEDWDRGSVGLDRSSGMSDGRHMLRVFRSGSRFLYSDPAGDDVSKSIVSCFCGFLHADLCAVCHLEEDKSGNESIGAWGRKTQRLVDVVHLRCEALHTLHEITSNVYGMSMHRNAASDSGWSMGDILGAADSQSGSVGDAVSAMCTLDNAVHGAKSSFSADTGAVSKSTLAELISDRAVCRYCVGDMDAALADCNEALSLDGLNGCARAVRARLLQQSAMECVGSGMGEETCGLWGAIQFAMEDEEEPAEQSAWLTEFPALKVALKEHLMPLEGEHPDVRCGRDDVKRVIGTSVASALLYASARDAMSGFLLGGAADQTLAALAEDCVRNASRKEAKDFFWQSRMSASGSSNMATFVSVFEGGNFRLPLQWERSFKMYFPRAWTVNMYLQSFEPLYLALEVYAEDNIVGSAAIRRTAALLSVSDDSSSLIDIDDDAVVDGATDIAQFSHLLPHGSRLKEHDGLAHRLLCCLVEALVFTSREMVDARDKESNGTPAVDVDTATLLPFSSAEQNPISSSECGKGLLECLRLLYAFTDAVPMAAVSELPLPHRLPLGVLLSVQLGNAADRGEIGVEDGCGETCLVPHVNFRLSAELKSRIRSVKEQAEEESSDDESDTGEGSVSNSRDTSGSDESSSTAEEHSISAPILSRLLSVISTIAHLCGDDVGAHRCLSAAVALSAEESGSRHCHDSRLKMACLLLEMHEFDEVSSLLMLHFADASNTSRRLISQAETYFEVNVPEADPGTFSELVTMMHKAELQVHKFDYEAAASRIRPIVRRPASLYNSMEFFIDNRFKKLQQISSRLGSYDSLPSFFLYNEDSVVLPKSVRDDLFVQITEHQSALLATAESLHGLIELRVNPTDTQRSLQMLKSAFKKFPENAALCNCIGEVLGQAGDAAGAMVEFRKAYLMSPNNPMPMLNAARVYQQLGQSVASEAHIREAMLRDNTLVLAYVDCAQLCLQAARGPAIGSAASDNCGHKAAQAKKAEVYLEKAVTLCRHISEIADVFATKAIAKIHLDVLEQNSSSHLF